MKLRATARQRLEKLLVASTAPKLGASTLALTRGDAAGLSDGALCRLLADAGTPL